MNNREKGNEYEIRAVNFLKKNGVRIVEQNFRFHRVGEIDIIGRVTENFEQTGQSIDYLVFFEVKYRKNKIKGDAASQVGKMKALKICRVCDCYRMINKIAADTPIRFDVIAIDADAITWVRNAFPYMGKS